MRDVGSQELLQAVSLHDDSALVAVLWGEAGRKSSLALLGTKMR